MKIKNVIFTTIITLSISNITFAKDYTLFNPTPDHKLRPLNSERSSKSDYVTTVDAGRVQLETSLVSITKNKDCNNGICTKTSQTTIGDTNNLRIGLTENSDLQIISNLYVNKKTSDYTNEPQNQYGYGDTTIRFKYSFAGNKGEKFGIALIPFIKLPSNQNNLGNNDVEGGIGVPFAFAFDDGWTIGGMFQANLLKEQNVSGDYQNKYYGSYLNAIYVSKSFTNKLSAFAEYAAYKANISNSWWQNTADFGVHYLLTPNFKVDIGTNIGLTNAADDLNYYTGITYRF